MNQVICPIKVGIDPEPVIEKHNYEFHKMTSDEYFKKKKMFFDIIFIDGLHHADQVFKDIWNSLINLNKGGTIVVHDCNPLTDAATVVPYQFMMTWNGDVYRAWLEFRTHPDLKMAVFDIDEGCGVIQRGHQKPINLKMNFLKIPYEFFDKNRVKWLNVLPYEKISEW
ncbi:MAG: class I SAM-dependent methyltransferase [Bacteroidia bacterium]|nr:class I SAM-dependent methyltransferase [Bacteroidia bacterium]